MDIRDARSWMYKRLEQGRKGLTDVFVQGVEEFVHVASQLPIFIAEGKFRCPCAKHRNTTFLTPDQIRVDLYRKGFLPNYWYWTRHGEIEPPIQYDQFGASSSAAQPPSEFDPSNYEEMIFDASRADFVASDPEDDEAPNRDAQKFYDMLNAAQQPLWDGCTAHSELSLSLRMLSIKSDHNISRSCFDEVAQLLKEVSPDENLVPADLYRTKKLVSKLGLVSEKIDCCVNGCMLYFKSNATDLQCRFCGHERFKPQGGKINLRKMFLTSGYSTCH